jgi:hypothetical protein
VNEWELRVTLRHWADDTLAEATGRDRRQDPVLPGSGGPAGNARLTAWTGLLLLVLFLVELVTLLSLDSLLSWHVAVGVLLVPPALLKTATTGWRIIGYYTKRPAYHRAGPPPMLLRLLGPLVVLFTLAVLGSGLALIAVGPTGSRTPFMSLLGFDVSALTVHQGTFVLWGVVTGLHTLARLVPAWRIVSSKATPAGRVPGRVPRGAVFIATLAVAGVATAILLGPASPWFASGALHHEHHHEVDAPGGQ